MKPQLEVRHLNLMVAISEEGTISKAAERLFLTQSALSHQLRDIEEKLETKLFLRLKKRMVLTPPGERLLHAAQKLLTELKTVEEDVRHYSSSNGGGILRLATECYTCYHWLPPLLSAFNEKYRNIKVQIVVEATRKPLQALLDGKIDLAIVSSEISDTRLSALPLFEDECVCIVSPSHPFASRRYLTAEDFSEEHLFTYALPAAENAIFQKLLLPNGVNPKQVTQVMLTEAIIEMVKAGLGIAVLAGWAVKPQVESGTLCAIPLTRNGLFRRWGAIMRKNQNMPEYLSTFTELIKKSIGKII